jgi:hypothetical protein
MKKWTKEEAVAWLKSHDFQSGDYDHAANYHRFRQKEPGQYYRFTNDPPSGHTRADGILFVYGWKKTDGKDVSEVQSVIFYHGEAESASADTTEVGVKDLLRYKDTWTHQRLPMSLVLKDVDGKQGVIQAYAAAFNLVDDDNEIVMPGAFERTIKQRGPTGSNRVAFLRQHRVDLLLGKPSVLKEDGFGLYFESKISQTSYGRDTLILYEDGVIDEHSFGFDVVKKHQHTDGPTELHELRLWDVSAVVWGSNEHTPFVGMKSIEQLNKAMNEVEAINRVLGRAITDDTAMGLEYLLRQLEQGMLDFVKAFATREPDGSTLRSALEASHGEIGRRLQKQLESMQEFLNRGS